MKKSPLILALILGCCAGCAPRYRVTLINGETITARGRPKLNDEGTRYTIVNNHGEKTEIAAGRVREIAPAAVAKKSSEFNYNPAP